MTQIYLAEISGQLCGPFPSEAEAEAFGEQVRQAADKLAIRIGVYVWRLRDPQEAFRS